MVNTPKSIRMSLDIENLSEIQEFVGSAVAEAFENGARAYAASDPCCGTYHLHEIINPHTGEPIPTREGEDDL